MNVIHVSYCISGTFTYGWLLLRQKAQEAMAARCVLGSNGSTILQPEGM